MCIYEKTEDMNYYASENPKQWGSMPDGKIEMETADDKWEIHTKQMQGTKIRKYIWDQGRGYRNQEVTAG